MKKILFLFLSMLSILFLHAQDKAAILKVLSKQETAWNNVDIETFMQGYWKSDSVLFIGKSGPIKGWDATIARYRKNYPDKAAMGILKYTIFKVELLDKNNAFVLGAFHLKRENDEPSGYFTLWFKKIKGEWLIVCDHTS